jgi:hypothetical protein
MKNQGFELLGHEGESNWFGLTHFTEMTFLTHIYPKS